MNNEIKEILWIIKSCKQDYDKQKDGMHTFDYGELYLLYNYITNLQQKEELLRQEISDVRKAFNDLQQENERLKFQLENQQIISSKYRMRRNIYKSRCEKINEILSEFPDFNYSNDYIILKRKIEEALQGSDTQ